MTLQGPGKIVQGSKYATPILNSFAIWWDCLSELVGSKLHLPGIFFRSAFHSVQGRPFQAAHPEHRQCGGYPKIIKKAIEKYVFLGFR